MLPKQKVGAGADSSTDDSYTRPYLFCHLEAYLYLYYNIGLVVEHPVFPFVV